VRPQAGLVCLAALALLLLSGSLASADDTICPYWPAGTDNLTTSIGAGFIRVGGPGGWPVATDTPSPFTGFYAVYRSTSSIDETHLGTYVGSVESSAASLVYDDYTGIPGEDYHYAVVAVDLAGNRSNLAPSEVKILVTASATTVPGSEVPHDAYTKTSSLCKDCHEVHASPGPTILRKGTEKEVCYTCHDGTGAATDIRTVFATRVSGHILEDTQTIPGPGLTQRCSSCHALHFSPSVRPNEHKTPINGSVVADDYTWCQACHNDAHDWIAGSYPYPGGGISASRPSRDASGYPELGTYGGSSMYNDTNWNPHNPLTSANVVWPSSGWASGDCRNCHDSHGNAAKYDALNATFRPSSVDTTESDLLNGTYAELCLTCHDGSPAASNIKQFVTYDATKTGDDYTGGHRIFTSGGNLPVGAPLPCYDCHNPHGTKGNNGSEPNRKLVSDEQWSGIDTASLAGVVGFCDKCHLPWEYVSGSGQPEANTVPAGQLTYIEGLDRRAAANKLSLPGGINAHGKTNMETPTESCYDCHGADYSAPSASAGYNVHRPARGGSCTGCHATAQDGGDGVPTRRAMVAEFSQTAHHVVGGSVSDNDCGVCHMEGTASDGSINSSYHKNNTVDLRDPDLGTAITGFTSFTRNTGSKTLETWVVNVQDNLCFKCHDSAGAGSSLARTPSGTAMRPFSSNSKDVPNIFSAFATSNNFHHAVRGAGANPYCSPTVTNGWVITMASPWNQLNDEHNVISCFDCHVATAGHGGANQDMGRQDFAAYSGLRALCVTCHKSSVYETNDAGSRFRDHDRSNHKSATYYCNGCHAGRADMDGGYTNGAPGNFHGAAWTWPANSQSPGSAGGRFLYGGWFSGWQNGPPGSAWCWGGSCAHSGGRSY